MNTTDFPKKKHWIICKTENELRFVGENYLKNSKI